ncbi:MAG TPA: hypothetical protein PKY50_06070 [Candidatus Competibacter sp.]|nr:hypothetical protein [Candidatus Competibacter sp.]
MMLLNDVDIDVSWLPSLRLLRLATEDVENDLHQSSVTERHHEDLCESRCIQLELITYGCIDARLP